MTPDQLDEAWDSTQQDAKDGDRRALATLRKYGTKPHREEPLPPSSVDWF